MSNVRDRVVDAMMYCGWSYVEVCGNTLYFTEGGVVDMERTIFWLNEELAVKKFMINAEEEPDEDGIENMFMNLTIVLKEGN